MPEPAHRPAIANWLLPLVLVLLLAIPLGAAVAIGEPEVGTAGLAKFSSAIGSVACADGITPVVTILLIEIGVAVLAVVAAFAVGKRSAWLFNLLREQGAQYIVLLLLIAIPFIIAWQTDSSVCSRGKSYFWQSVFIEAFILATLAISYNLIFGFAGVISFGHAAFFGIGAYAIGLLILHLEWPLGISVLATLIISTAMGVLVSVIA
ncbi:MAG TPA: hypothetical protein V6D20_16825, partial [Candidatus Obscuribacterales bacterium]